MLVSEAARYLPSLVSIYGNFFPDEFLYKKSTSSISRVLASMCRPPVVERCVYTAAASHLRCAAIHTSHYINVILYTSMTGTLCNNWSTSCTLFEVL